jgi:AcrR family transcriptional regulator
MTELDIYREKKTLGGEGSGTWAELALEGIADPVASLPPAAQRVLNGAMRVVVAKGFGRMTLAAISAASGENVAAVKYYFGNKAGLVDVLLEAVVYNELKLLIGRRRKGSAGDGLSRLTEEIGVLSTPDRSDRVLWELLPHALRDRRLRERLQRYYESFFELHMKQLGAGAGADSELRQRMSGFAMILSAVADGLTIHSMVAPAHFDPQVALGALDELLRCTFPELDATPNDG